MCPGEKGQPRNKLDTDLARKGVYDLVRSASMKIKKSRERRLVEREVLGADDILCVSGDPASSDISPVLAQHSTWVGA